MKIACIHNYFMITQTIRLLLAVSMGMCLSQCAMPQYTPLETTKVVTVSGVNQKEVFNRCRQWFSEYFVSGESVVDYEDAQVGTVIGKGVGKIGSDPLGIIAYHIRYTIRIDTKDGRMKITTKILNHTNNDGQRAPYDVNYIPQSRNDKAVRHMAEIVSEIERYVTTTRGDSSSSW